MCTLSAKVSCGASVQMEDMLGLNLLSEEHTIIITLRVFFHENSCEHLFSSFKTLVHQQTNEKQSCVHIGSNLVWLAGFHRKTFPQSSIIRLAFIREVQVFFFDNEATDKTMCMRRIINN